MAEKPPIACSLSSAEMKDREGAWHTLMAGGLVRREVVPGGIRLIPAPEAAAQLLELIELERECCAWIHFEVAGGSAVTLTADREGESVLAGMFQTG